ncbi:MAG: prepilin peptidase [Lachnospiraceae bacterium]|nr:prepilin peptidase [Lachnospiraceae bacterium]
MIGIVGALIIYLLAAFCDYRKRKIPNLLIVIGLLVGLIPFLCRENYNILLKAISLSIVLVALLFPFFMIGGLGAGDIKLICLLPFFYNQSRLFGIVIVFGIISAVVAIRRMISTHSLVRILYMKEYFINSVYSGELIPYAVGETEVNTLSLGVYLGIAVSVVTALSLCGVM